jgi:hypothetical protein
MCELGVDLMAKARYLEILNKIKGRRERLTVYKENLDDAIEGTQDAE